MVFRVIGCALLLFVAVDSFLTVLLPSARGVASTGLVRALWAAAARTPGRVGHHARQAAGPLSVVLTIVAWVVLLWLGFALIYLPDVDSLGYSSDVQFEGNAFVAALYLSGTLLTTLGLGDVAAQTDALRIVSVIEAGCGLAIFTAALGYLPQLYTVVSELRIAAEAVSDLQATTPEAAVELLQTDAVLTLEAVRRDVISARQHLLRFPVLHYFHPPAGQSVLGVVEGATMLWLVGRYGLAADRHPTVQAQARSLELALSRLVDDAGRHVGVDGGDDAAAREQVAAVRQAVRSLGPDLVATTDVPDQALDELARTNAVLRGYARMHGYAFPS